MKLLAVVIALVSGTAAADPPMVKVVDDAGQPVAGASVQWGNPTAEWVCDVTNIAIVPRYDDSRFHGGGTVITQPDGTAILPATAVTVRAVTTDGRAAFAALAHGTTLTVHPLATIVVEPTCDGPCKELGMGGDMTVDGARCTLDGIRQPGHFERLARGDLHLRLWNGLEAADQRVLELTHPVTGDETLRPRLPIIAGNLTLRGRVTIHGTESPRENNYSLIVRCGTQLERSRSVAPDGSFEVPFLPAGACTLNVDGFAGGKRYERTVTVHGGTTVQLELAP